MRILLLAPQPFFTIRGTPIALHNLLKALEETEVVKNVTLLTFPFGESPFYEKVVIKRVDKIPFTSVPKPSLLVL